MKKLTILVNKYGRMTYKHRDIGYICEKTTSEILGVTVDKRKLKLKIRQTKTKTATTTITLYQPQAVRAVFWKTQRMGTNIDTDTRNGLNLFQSNRTDRFIESLFDMTTETHLRIVAMPVK